jgi:5-methylcytosine-specific restriction endonuclease McrA
MTTQFDAFCTQLSFRKEKKNVVKTELIRLYYRSINDDVDVWGELRDLDIPKSDTVDRVEGKKIMSKLREFLAKKQNYRCCYCQRYLFNIAYARPIEHILPRRFFPRFSLILKNLSVACYDCNLKKSDSIWWGGIDPQGEYPEQSQLDLAFHCNNHQYNDHITWVSYATNDFSFNAYGALTTAGKKLYIDLLQDISKTDILLSRDDGLKASLESLKIINESGLGGDSVRDFLHELQRSLLSTTEIN